MVACLIPVHDVAHALRTRPMLALFELDGELHSKMDFAKLDDPKVAFLLQLQVLLLDEAWGQKQHRLPKSISIYATLRPLMQCSLPGFDDRRCVLDHYCAVAEHH